MIHQFGNECFKKQEADTLNIVLEYKYAYEVIFLSADLHKIQNEQNSR